MKTLWMATVVAGLTLTAAASQDGAAKQDKDRLQGTWKLVSSETNGQKVPEAVVKNTTLRIRGNEFVATILMNLDNGIFAESVSESTFQLDSTKKPKAIDFILTQTPNKTKALGIYELKGETLRICTSDPGQARPTEFASKPGSGTSLSVYKRTKP